MRQDIRLDHIEFGYGGKSHSMVFTAHEGANGARIDIAVNAGKDVKDIVVRGHECLITYLEDLLEKTKVLHQIYKSQKTE